MPNARTIVALALAVLTAVAAPSLWAQEAAERTPEAFDGLTQTLDRLLNMDPPDTDQAARLLMPWLTGQTLPARLKIDVTSAARRLALATDDVNQQTELYTRASVLAASVTDDDAAPAAVRLQSLVAQGRMHYELGKIFQRRWQAAPNPKQRQEYVERSNAELEQAIGLFNAATARLQEAEDSVWDILDRLLDRHNIDNEENLPPPAKAELDTLRGGMYQGYAEALLFRSWSLYTQAKNMRGPGQDNPLPERRRELANALRRLSDNNIDTGSLPLLAAWIYLNKPDMLPASAMQAMQGRAIDSFREFVEFCGDAPIAYLGRFGIAQSLFDMGRYPQALEMYRSIVELGTPERTAADPSLDQAVQASMERVAECLFELGRTDEGVAAFRTLLDRYPREGDVELQIEVFRYRALANQIRSQRDSGAAPEELRRSAEEILGQMRSLLGNPDIGPNLFETVSHVIEIGGLAHPPDWPEVQFALSFNAYEAGNYSEAVALGRRALDRIDQLQHQERRADVAARIADVLIDSYLNLDPPEFREAAQAAAVAEQAAATENEKAHFAFTQMAVWWRQFQRSEARDTDAQRRYQEAMRHLVERYPQTVRAQEAVFRLAEVERGNAEDRIAEAARVQPINPGRAAELRQQAATLMEQAIDYYENVDPQSVYRAQALVMKGVTAERLGRFLREHNIEGAAERSAELRDVARHSFASVADPQTEFAPDTRDLTKWRADASIRMAQMELSDGTAEALQNARQRLDAAAAMPGLDGADEARVLFLNFEIALEMSRKDTANAAEHLDRAAALLDDYRQREPDARQASYVLRSFGHTLARRYRQLVQQERERIDPARREEIVRRGPQIVSLLYNGYMVWPLPSPDQRVQEPRLNLQQAMAVFRDLVFVEMQHDKYDARAFNEALRVGRGLMRHQDTLARQVGPQELHRALLLMALMAIESDTPLEADTYLAQHPSRDHPQIIELRARANMAGWDRAGADKRQELRGNAVAAIGLWDEVNRRATSHELRFEAIYHHLRLMWELGQEDADMKGQAAERAEQIRVLYPRGFIGATPQTQANLERLLIEITGQ